MSVYYLIIADKSSNKILGEYCDVSQGGSIQEFNTVKAKGQELFASTTETQIQNSSTELTNFTLYYQSLIPQNIHIMEIFFIFHIVKTNIL